MSGPQDLDELFGEGGGQPEPRTATVVALVVVGLLLAVVGLACTSAPGGLLVLLAWTILEKDMDRVESGYLPAEVRPRLVVLQRATWVAILCVIALFCAQLYLLCNGTYKELWSAALTQLAG